MKQDNEQSCIIESSFLRGNLQEDQFESLCRKCQLEWLTTKCQSGNPILTICVNEECQNGIFDCNIFTCKCAEKHKVCKTVKVTAFSDFLNQMTQYQKSFFKKLYLIDEELIQKIKKSQQAVVKMISSGSLDEKSVQGLQIITAQKGSQNFHGKQADELYNKLRLKARQKNLKETQLQKLFSQRSNQMIDTNINLKTLIYQNFLKGSIPTVPQIPKPNYFINSPLITICINELYMSTPAFYQKKTYNNYGYLQYPDKEKMEFQKKHMDYLKTQLGNPISSALLFRASEHNFQAAQFHTKCDTKAKTLTIVRTQFRKTIFAYAEQPWSSNTEWVNDPTGKSCIVWLDPPQKLSLTNATYSIYCNASYGPTFGGGHDLYLQNGPTGSAPSAHSYTNANRNGQTQINYTFMSGNPNGNGFKVLQYEVYQLNF